MIKKILAVCANRIILDAATNKVSLIDVIENFVVRTLPFTPPPFACLFVFERDESDPPEYKITFSIEPPNQARNSITETINFGQHTISRSMYFFDGLGLKEEGLLTFEISWADTVIGNVSIPIKKMN